MDPNYPQEPPHFEPPKTLSNGQFIAYGPWPQQPPPWIANMGQMNPNQQPNQSQWNPQMPTHRYPVSMGHMPMHMPPDSAQWQGQGVMPLPPQGVISHPSPGQGQGLLANPLYQGQIHQTRRVFPMQGQNTIEQTKIQTESSDANFSQSDSAIHIPLVNVRQFLEQSLATGQRETKSETRVYTGEVTSVDSGGFGFVGSEIHFENSKILGSEKLNVGDYVYLEAEPMPISPMPKIKWNCNTIYLEDRNVKFNYMMHTYSYCKIFPFGGDGDENEILAQGRPLSNPNHVETIQPDSIAASRRSPASSSQSGKSRSKPTKKSKRKNPHDKSQSGRRKRQRKLQNNSGESRPRNLVPLDHENNLESIQTENHSDQPIVDDPAANLQEVEEISNEALGGESESVNFHEPIPISSVPIPSEVETISSDIELIPPSSLEIENSNENLTGVYDQSSQEINSSNGQSFSQWHVVEPFFVDESELPNPLGEPLSSEIQDKTFNTEIKGEQNQFPITNGSKSVKKRKTDKAADTETGISAPIKEDKNDINELDEISSDSSDMQIQSTAPAPVSTQIENDQQNFEADEDYSLPVQADQSESAGRDTMESQGTQEIPNNAERVEPTSAEINFPVDINRPVDSAEAIINEFESSTYTQRPQAPVSTSGRIKLNKTSLRDKLKSLDEEIRKDRRLRAKSTTRHSSDSRNRYNRVRRDHDHDQSSSRTNTPRHRRANYKHEPQRDDDREVQAKVDKSRARRLESNISNHAYGRSNNSRSPQTSPDHRNRRRNDFESSPRSHSSEELYDDEIMNPDGPNNPAWVYRNPSSSNALEISIDNFRDLASPNSSPYCSYHKSYGHQTSECRGYHYQRKYGLRCMHCKRTGHSPRICPNFALQSPTQEDVQQSYRTVVLEN